MKQFLAALAFVIVALFAVGCGSNADTVDKNLIKEAEKFNVQRHIVGINGITDKILFEVEGKCSLEFPPGRLEALCKHGDKDFRKHHISGSRTT